MEEAPQQIDAYCPKLGDAIILYGGPSVMIRVLLEQGGVTQGQYGIFPHESIVGVPFGSKVSSSKGVKGWMYVMPLTPEIFTNGGAERRTQVIHSNDIAQILLNLELTAGCAVAESGTGSGSLTCSLSRLVGAMGQVYSFEFHEGRSIAARQAFQEMGMSHNVVVTLRDVCMEGFLLDGGRLEPGGLDAIFLDLPSPWEAVPHALDALKSGHMLCSYSPCIEQVQRTCQMLEAKGCDEVYTIESIERPWTLFRANADWETVDVTQEVPRKKKGHKEKRRREDMPVVLSPSIGEIRGHTAYLTFARKP